MPFLSRLAARALLLAAPAVVSSTVAAQQPLTAAAAWTRIQHRYAPSLPADTVDTLKAGDPSTPVTGIVTTFLDTMDVLRQAVAHGDNLVISHEPTFYNHRDDTTAFTNDPVYKEKLAFIQQHHLVVYRLHDGIHSNPDLDPFLSGFYQAVGWSAYPHPAGEYSHFFLTLPPTTLAQLASALQAKLGIRTLRVEGRPDLPVTHVAFLPGAAGLKEQVLALNHPDTEVLIAGEASEWETVEYVRDAVAQGRPKALILLGHQVSEEPGMEQCAADLRTLFPGVRVDHILAGQPLWNPEHPPSPR